MLFRVFIAISISKVLTSQNVVPHEKVDWVDNPLWAISTENTSESILLGFIVYLKPDNSNLVYMENSKAVLSISHNGWSFSHFIDNSLFKKWGKTELPDGDSVFTCSYSRCFSMRRKAKNDTTAILYYAGTESNQVLITKDKCVIAQKENKLIMEFFNGEGKIPYLIEEKLFSNGVPVKRIRKYYHTPILVTDTFIYNRWGRITSIISRNETGDTTSKITIAYEKSFFPVDIALFENNLMKERYGFVFRDDLLPHAIIHYNVKDGKMFIYQRENESVKQRK